MLTFSQYRIDQALNIQKDLLQRGNHIESGYYFGMSLIGYYVGYLQIVGADEALIKEVSDLALENHKDLNKIIDEMVAKNQTEHNDY